MVAKKRTYIHSKRNNPSSRFDKKLVLQIVQEVEAGLSRKDACVQYGMAYGTLNEWVRKFASENYRASLRKTFSAHQRRKIVRQIKEQKLTRRQARELYQVSNKTLNTWLREAKKEDTDLAGLNQSAMIINQTNYSAVELHSQLQQAQLKIKALETMIDIAEQQFKIAIRKKPGAKQ